mgnify:CR=1 FL=1
MSLFSLGLLAAYFAGGMQYMMNQEGWDAADAFYFWSKSVWKSTSELGCYGENIASMAWGARNLISTQVYDREHGRLR